MRTTLHTYEIREFDDKNEAKIVMQIKADPKTAKQKLKEYSEKNPGAYSLYQVKYVISYFTEKEN